MQESDSVAKWGTDILVSNGYSIKHPPEIILSTPWSTMICFSTAKDDFYLKQTPPAISAEPQIIELLSEQFHASVPVVIDSNDNLHCFLMSDAGKVLRSTLKEKFSPDLLCQAIKEYAAIQRSAEDHVEKFIKLGVPDWRLAKLPILYNQIIKQTDFLKADGMTDKELHILQDLSPQFLAQCELLSSYGVPEAIGIPDFNDNNILLNQKTKRMTFIDWGEATITHPFFSLYNSLEQSIIHHGVKEADQTYNKLQDACLNNWLGLATQSHLLEAFNLSKQLRAIYDALSYYRLMTSVDLQALNSYYVNKPNRLAGHLRKYIASSTER
jgi:hypothetical protein